MKGIVSIVLSLVLLLSLSPVAFAADPPETTEPTVGTPANGPVGSAEGSRLFTLATTSDGISVVAYRNSITEQSSAYLHLYGYTASNVTADRLEVNFTLQQWNGSSWISYNTSNNYYTYTDTFSVNIYRLVAHGYYYRVKTVHKAFLGLDSDEVTLYSSYIYVS